MQQVKATPAAWRMTTHLSDYSIDFFATGAIDSTERKIADRVTAYVTRGVIALADVWDSHGHEADCAWSGPTPTGSRSTARTATSCTCPSLRPTFSGRSPCAPLDFYLVANPIDRCPIGDRTPGLERADDGTVTLRIQQNASDGEKAANWLPAPAGPFRPAMRMNQPRSDILDGTYALPQIVRLYHRLRRGRGRLGAPAAGRRRTRDGGSAVPRPSFPLP